MMHKQSTQALTTRRAFTLIELLVVIAVMIILMAIMLPAIKSLTRNNGQKQAVNQVTAMLANARSTAIATRRQTGIVFYEETAANVTPANPNQTAAQMITADADQTQYTGVAAGNTIFVHLGGRELLPRGVRLSVLNDDASRIMITGDTAGGSSRVIMFNPKGQMITRVGIARPSLTVNPKAPKFYSDWKITTPGGAAADGVSSPGVIVFNYNDFKQNNFPTTTAGQTAAGLWIQQHADVLVVNSYTGNVIR